METSAWGPRVLVVDAGSHSLRLAVVSAAGERERVEELDVPPGSREADALYDTVTGGLEGIDAVAYRVVHGGPDLTVTVELDEGVIERLRAAVPMAPMHLPPVIRAVERLRARFPDLPHVAAFDTAFHASMPEAARTYALPESWRQRWDLRRYGFHGLSYASALERAAPLLRREASELQAVLAHLGGGSSVCAVRGGVSVWTSMGATPLDGLVMATRSGSVDPGLVLDLLERRGLSPGEVREGLQSASGLLGLSGGRSGDTRELVAAASRGDRAARLALDVFALRARQGIAAAAVLLERLDALVLTGEIGADQPELRQQICSGLAPLGLEGGLVPVVEEDAVVSRPEAAVPVLVLTVGEDLEVAAEARRLLSGRFPPRSAQEGEHPDRPG